MRVLILGGTKFIGPCVVRSLREQDCEVMVFHRGQSNAALPSDVKHILGDRNNLEEFKDAFAAFAPDVVLDMRPIGEKDSQRVMQLFAGMARRAVMVSSIDVYRNYDVLRRKEPGPPDPAPLTEDSPLRPQLYPYRDPDNPESFGNVYDKILAERVYMGNPDLPGTVVRLPFVYGPGDYQRRLHWQRKRMDDGRPALLMSAAAADWPTSRCYVENVGAAIALAVVREQATDRIYHVAEPHYYTGMQWATLVKQAAGWTGEIIPLPDDQLPPDLRFEEDPEALLTIDSTRIRSELGYAEAVAQNEALLRTLAWERANPPEQEKPETFDYAAEDAILQRLDADRR